MKATFRTFESGAGDCIFLILEDYEENSSYHIMVDCNVLTPEIKHFIKEDLKMQIDTLIVTHIDSDHANGITKIMRSPDFSELRIRKIIFNGFQPLDNDNLNKLDGETKAKLDDVFALLPPVVDEMNHKTNGMDAACLITEINRHPLWKQVWIKKPILAGNCIILDDEDKWGKLRFLSPTQTFLDKLLHEVKLEYARQLGVAPPNGDFEDQEKYFELMLRLSEIRKRTVKIHKTNNLIINKKLMETYAKIDADESCVTTPNKASLAFSWENADSTKCILFMGDAVPSQVLSELNKINQERIKFEVMKVSHHGSKNNTSICLIDKVDTEHYFITGGKKGEGPHIETIAKIAKKSSESVEYRELHYNHTNGIDLWNQLEEEDIKPLLNECHLRITKDNKYEFEY